MAGTYRLSRGRKAYNQLIRGLVGLGIPMGSYRLLTVAGRRSGQPRTTPLAMLSEDGRRWLIAPYGEVAWVHNVRAAGGEATLTHARRTERVRLREVPPGEAAPLLKRYVEKYRALVGPFFNAKAGDPVDRFAPEVAGHPVFEVLPDRR